MTLKGMTHKPGKAGMVRVDMLIEVRGEDRTCRTGLQRWVVADVTLAVDVTDVTIPIDGRPWRMQGRADVTEADFARLGDLTSAWTPIEISELQPDLLGGDA